MTVLAYLAAIVTANLLASTFGPSVTVVTAFFLIGATLTLRDRIHDTLGPRAMLWLIPLGAGISALFGAGAGRIALASLMAFAVSETLDTVVYHALRRWPWLERVNGSNVVSAAADSLLFPVIAFGGLLWPIIVGQFLAKMLGGALWSVILRRPKLAAVAAALILTATSVDAQQSKPPRFVVQAQAGPMFYPFRDYRPVANAGLNTLVFLPSGFSLLFVWSRDIEPRAGWVGVAALQYRLWSR